MYTNERIIGIKLEVSDKQKLIVIQIYAPTSLANESESMEFYSKLTQTINNQKTNKNDTILISGDFNNQVGKR